jgi:hypothetical protein
MACLAGFWHFGLRPFSCTDLTKQQACNKEEHHFYPDNQVQIHRYSGRDPDRVNCRGLASVVGPS